MQEMEEGSKEERMIKNFIKNNWKYGQYGED